MKNQHFLNIFLGILQFFKQEKQSKNLWEINQIN